MSQDEKYFVDSSFIKHISWDNKTKNLIVTFGSGSIWLYKKVTRKKYKELCEANSLGVYFNKNIRNSHKGTPIARVGNKGIIIYDKGGEEIVSTKEKEQEQE